MIPCVCILNFITRSFFTGFECVLNIQETIRISYNMYSMKELLLNGYTNQINNRKSFFIYNLSVFISERGAVLLYCFHNH